MGSWPIARGRVSHTLREDFGALFAAMTKPLDNDAWVIALEKDFAEHVGREKCIAFPFARTAIHGALKSLDLNPGDRVLLPGLTIKPILDVVLGLGLTPVFVDVDLETGSFDFHSLERGLNQRPSVAILTYLFGLVPNVERIIGLLRSSNVFVIEDFSQCLNGKFNGRNIGTFGDVSIYSASSVKTLDTFGGGFLLCDSGSLAEKLRQYQGELAPSSRLDLLRKILVSLVRNFMTQRLIFGVLTWPVISFLRKIGVRVLERFAGARSAEPLTDGLPPEWFRRYTSVQARFGLKQLKAVGLKDQKRVQNVSALTRQFSALVRPVGSASGTHVYWQLVVFFPDTQVAVKQLAESRVDTGTTSLSLVGNLPKYTHQGSTPNARYLFENGLYLPCYHQLSDGEVSRISVALKRIMEN